MANRKCDLAQQPLTIYEIHSPTWQLDDQGKTLNWRALAPKLADYCKTQGYNALELMALFAHTQPISMGYQITNYFAPNSEMGSWEDFQFFVNYMHNVDLGNGRTGIRLIADWVPAHFALDEWALSNFDGTPLMENEDPSVALHPKWGTKIFDFKRQFTKNFFISNADFLLDKLHIDGLRVDAVSSMLFYNYDREKQISEGNYKKRFNRHGSEIDSDAKGFIRNMNNYIHTQYPEALMVAEEATGFSNLTRPPEQRGESATRRGLGFDCGWHMGWMNDSLKYWVMSSPERKKAFSLLTHTVENVDGGSDIHPRGTVVLAYSHDETANGKGTILGNMPSGANGRDRSQKYANGRLALAYQLLRGGGPTLDFMGNELLQSTEWHGRLKENIDHPKQKAKSTVQWEELDPSCDTAEYQFHRGSQTCRKDLNHLFLNSPGLCDQTDHGFSWINATDSANCVMSFHRRSRDDKQQFACIFNTSDRDISDYLIALPDAKCAPELDGLVGIREVYNTDALVYGGKGRENQHVEIVRDRATGRPTHFKLRLPPCTAIVLQEYFS
jgi:1,4-alpha-glucan branching enzyme